MKKKLIVLILAAAILLSLVPGGASADSGFDIGDATFKNNYGGPVTLADPGTGEQEEDTETPTTPTTPASSAATQESGTWYSLIAKDEASQRFSDTAAGQVYSDDDRVTFIVVTDQRPLLQIYSVEDISCQTQAVRSSEAVRTAALDTVAGELEDALEGDIELGYRYTVATTAISVTTSYGNRETIESLPGVDHIYVAPTFRLCDGDFQPSTGNASGMIGAGVVNNSGYTGVGTKIAIVDTGLYPDHPSFEPLPEEKLTDDSLTTDKVSGVWSKLHASESGHKASETYVSTKVPFAYNYAFRMLDTTHASARSDHGTHVAGIAAANKVEGTEAVGIAPDAQVIVMQVFAGDGAEWDVILAALEDCVYLGVDTVNLSLGSSAGFTDPAADEAMLKVMENFRASGIQLLAAAGNDYSSAFQNLTGTNMSLAGNPDTGLVGSPSTFSAAVCVASADNDLTQTPYVTAGKRDIPVIDTSAVQISQLIYTLGGKTVGFVPVPGEGNIEDYKNLSISGKIALVERGGSSFTEKQAAAKKAGASACIIYNNEPGILSMQTNSGMGHIPCVAISQDDGEYLKKLYDNGTTTLTVCKDSRDFVLERTISSFSSWGVTPDLKLKPEITGVGGNIYSSVDPRISGRGGYYATMSGTSMATPQISGAMAVIYQYLADEFPDLSAPQRREIALDLAMSTAGPVLYGGQLEYSPRQQGAGLVDLVAATTAQAYLTSPSAADSRPKAELGDSESGVYSFPFTIHNMSGEDKVYTFASSILTETLRTVDGVDYIAGAPHALESKVKITSGLDTMAFDLNGDGETTTEDAYILLRHVDGSKPIEETRQLDVDMDGKIDRGDVQTVVDYCAELDGALNAVTVPAGGEVTLTCLLEVTDADKSYLASFPNGEFVEGYLYALPISASGEGVSEPELSMPILGFYGDWSKAPLFDDVDDPCLYGTHVYAMVQELSTNPYMYSSMRAGAQFNAVSQQNFLEEIDFGLLRGAKTVRLTVKDTETQNILFTGDVSNVSKSYYSASYGMIIPAFIFGRDVLWSGSQDIPEGTHVEYTVQGFLDDGDDICDGGFSFEMSIDNTYPQLLESKTYRAEDGRQMLSLTMEDNLYIAAVLFVSPHGVIMGKHEVVNTPGEPVTVDYDITGLGSDIRVVVADYAVNETVVDLSLDIDENDPVVRTLDKGRLYGSETYSQGILEYGWFSVDKNNIGRESVKNETFDSNRYYAAEYVNGRLIAQNIATGALVAVTPYSSLWEEEVLISQSAAMGKNGTWCLYDMALDYKNSKLYAVGWEYAGEDSNSDGNDDGTNYLYEIDFTGERVKLKKLAKMTGADDGVNILTLACDNEGNLYGISVNSKLYKIGSGIGSKAGECEFIAETGFPYSANVIQSMTYDHDGGVFYWGAVHSDGTYTSTSLTTIFYSVDVETGKCQELGTYGHAEPTGLFVPTDRVSGIFDLDAEPMSFALNSGTALMIEGQTKQQKIDWLPWNSKAPEDITWSSDDPSVIEVDDKGNLTALTTGTATVSAVAEIGGRRVTNSLTIRVVHSAGTIYGFMVVDYSAGVPYDANDAPRQWISYSDLAPQEATVFTDSQTLDGTFPAMWQGGAYANGKLYSTYFHGPDSVVYVSDVEFDGDGAVTGFGEPKELCTTDLYVGNMGVDYAHNRIIFKELSQGGLGAIDLETNEVTFLGKYNPKLAGNFTSTDMCVMPSGQVIVADTGGGLYIVDPDTMETRWIAELGIRTYDYGSMFYDYNTDNIYWAPCDRTLPDPCLYVLRVLRDDKGSTSALIANLGPVKSARGTEQTIMFTVPTSEPELGYMGVEGVSIDQGDVLHMLVGGTADLTYTVYPEEATPGDITWSSDDENIVTVDADGSLTAVSAGTATVTLAVAPVKPNEISHIDRIKVTVNTPARKPVYAFVISDNADIHDTWLTAENDTIAEPDILASANSYELYSGAYHDGFFYGYDKDGSFYRADIDDLANAEELGEWTLENGDEVVSMGYDEKNGRMIGFTLQKRLVEINLENGETSQLDDIPQQTTEPGKYVSVITVDKNGVIWGVGGYNGTPASLFTLNPKTSQSGRFQTIGGLLNGDCKLAVTSSAGSPRAQMAYDQVTNSLYIYAPVYKGSGNTLIRLQLDENGQKVTEFKDIGPLALGNGDPNGLVTLGLIAFVPTEEPEPVPES